ncbi:MAG: gamma-glutamyltransferase [Planctomycetes bacterium]|nr:gamma-glutamyltransferase [Planctomycetota bacterium]
MFDMRTVAAALLFLASCAGPAGRIALDRGVVASPEPHASEAGAAVLRDGGNAVDAAIAIQFVLAVTFPNAGNLGGGGFMLVHTGAGESSIDYRETAPAAAHRDLFLDAKGEVVPGLSLDTAKAAGVPGTVAGMWLAHRKFGSLPWKRLLEPAIRLAEEGWVLDRWSAGGFARERRNNFHDYFHGAAGGLLVQKELAATLRRIAEGGRDGFYLGETARLVVEEMKRSGGILSLEDLSAYQAKLRTPLEGSYRGLRVVSMAPPSSGGVALLQLLNMMEPRDPKALGFHSAAHLHLVAEISKRVFADRSEHLGDADFVSVPARRLIAKDYAAERMKGFSPERRSDSGAITHGTMPKESEQTTHFSVVDRRGNAVSNTTTLNGGFGCGLVVRGAGFLLNNEMDDFSAKPGVPNLFGVIGREANAIAPGKRMLSSMCPTFVFRDGSLWLVLGTPGGPTIFTTVFQVIVNRVDFGFPLAKAVAAPRFHHQWPPLRKGSDPIYIEEDFKAGVRDALVGLGYTWLPRGRIGDVHAIEIEEGVASGVSDPRGIGRVVLE